MGSEVIIVPLITLAVFGIAYYYLTTRNKERLALIEAGADAKLFKSEAKSNAWYFVLVLGMLAVGIALGTGLGGIFDLTTSGAFNDGAYVVGIFLSAGVSLIASFFMIRKLKKEDKE